ncbi:TniB family NTP-binding protein [Devosia sp. LjRoot3]|uniref:TniB family NTP-binding protein n=1 Tax=Devosia sp. LjRoot3 TaxID=3342319 RepID=UPI003ECCB587
MSEVEFDLPAPDSERNSKIGRAVVPMRSMKRIINALDDMYRLYGTRHQGQICAIVGPTHTGKSIARETFMKQKAKQLGGYVENIDRDKEIISEVANISFVTVVEGYQITHPVICIQILDNPTFNALADNTLRALLRGKPPNWDNGGDLASLLQEQLTGRKTRLVIYDDVQEIGKIRGGNKNAAVTMLKALCKVAKVEVAAIGIEGTLEVLTSGKEISELVCKRVIIRPLPEPNWEADDKGEFVTFLTNLRKVLPFHEQSPIDEQPIAQPLWEYSQGVIGTVKALLQSATDFAIQNDRPCVDRDVMRLALYEDQSVYGENNPFYVKGDKWDF